MDEIFALDRDKAMQVLGYAFKKKFDKLFIRLEGMQFHRNLNRLELRQK